MFLEMFVKKYPVPEAEHAVPTEVGRVGLADVLYPPILASLFIRPSLLVALHLTSLILILIFILICLNTYLVALYLAEFTRQSTY